MVNILTGTPFEAVPRLHHRADEVALEGDSSAPFGRRNLVGLMGVMMASSGNAEEEMYKELYNYLVARTMSGEVKVDSESIGTYGMACLPSVTSIIAPNLASAGQFAFYGDSNLVSVRCNDTLTISSSCFLGCTKLKNIGNDNKVKGKFQGNSQFQNCSSIETVDIDLAHGAIGANTFSGCTSLRDVTFRGEKIFYSNGTSSWSGIGNGTATVRFLSNTVSEILAIANIMNGLKTGTTVVCSDGQFVI